MPHEAVILVLADKLDNIRAIREDLEINGTDIWGRFNAGEEKQKWYYDSLASVISGRLTDQKSSPMIDLFRREVGRVFSNRVNNEDAMERETKKEGRY